MRPAQDLCHEDDRHCALTLKGPREEWLQHSDRRGVLTEALQGSGEEACGLVAGVERNAVVGKQSLEAVLRVAGLAVLDGELGIREFERGQSIPIGRPPLNEPGV